MNFKYIKKVSEQFIYNFENPQIGKVELWDFSKSNICEEAKQEAVATVASISYGNEQAKNPEKLWDLLEKAGHNSPFEFLRHPKAPFIHSSFRNWPDLYDCYTNSGEEYYNENIAVFKIKIPIFVMRQYIRHRGFSFMEMSRRFTRPDKIDFEYYFPKGLHEGIKKMYIDTCESLFQVMIYDGFKLEQARIVLPLGLYTEFWVMKDYRNALNFYIERFNTHAQWEIKECARVELELLKKYQPEFEGANVYVQPNEEPVHILDLKKYGEEIGKKVLTVDYLCDNYYARFDVEKGLFCGKIKKDVYEYFEN